MNFYENGQQIRLSVAVLMDLNENTNRTAALAKLMMYLKLFNGASLAPQGLPTLPPQANTPDIVTLINSLEMIFMWIIVSISTLQISS